MKTFNVKPADIKKTWVVVDASGQTVGRLASEIARVLRGKNEPTFTPHLDVGDNVVVINAEKVKLTGTKLRDKFYYNYSGYMGGMKATSAEDMLATHPERVITRAVQGMLPKNKLSRHLMCNLKVYAGEKHPHDGQKPVAMGPRTKAN